MQEDMEDLNEIGQALERKIHDFSEVDQDVCPGTDKNMFEGDK